MQSLLECSQIKEVVNYLKTFKCNNACDLARYTFLLREGYTDEDVVQWTAWYNMTYCSYIPACSPLKETNCATLLITEILPPGCPVGSTFIQITEV